MTALDLFSVASGLASLISLGLAIAALGKAKDLEARLTTIEGNSSIGGSQTSVGWGNLQAGRDITTTRSRD